MGSFFQPTYEHKLVPDWLPALHEVTDKLADGGTVADVGCGVGHTTLLIAKAFPQATVHGFDYSEEAISIARELAEEAGLSDRVVFEVASADDYPGSGYDLVCFFNALHDMGDPVAAAQHVHKSLDADGTWMLVESNVSPQDIDTQTPAARMFMALSAVMCLPVAVAQRGPHALGNHSGEKAFRAIAEEAGHPLAPRHGDRGQRGLRSPAVAPRPHRQRSKHMGLTAPCPSPTGSWRSWSGSASAPSRTTTTRTRPSSGPRRWRRTVSG